MIFIQTAVCLVKTFHVALALEEEYAEKLKIDKININLIQELAEKYGTGSTILVFLKTAEVSRLAGAVKQNRN